MTVTAVNANSSLTGVGLSAAVNTPAILSTAQTFSASKVLPSGSSNATVTAVDGSNNSIANNYQLGVTGSPSTSLTYDLNGNMTSDGTNTYLWDAENRLIQINYPGSGNNSQFTFDGLGYCVDTVETRASIVTGAKHFIWCGGKMCEARNASSGLVNQYLVYGQTIAGTNYFCTRDHLDSIREMTDSSGNIQVQYQYDPYGRATNLQGSLVSDFQYAGYYFHAPSSLNLTVSRAYNATLGRWINRDLIDEDGGINLFAYVLNEPVLETDPSGEGINGDNPFGDPYAVPPSRPGWPTPFDPTPIIPTPFLPPPPSLPPPGQILPPVYPFPPPPPPPPPSQPVGPNQKVPRPKKPKQCKNPPYVPPPPKNGGLPNPGPAPKFHF